MQVLSTDATTQAPASETAPNTEAPASAPDLNDERDAIWAKHEAGESAEQKAEPEKDANDRLRDPQTKRFVAKDKAPDEQEGEPEQAEQQEPEKPARTSLPLPASWSPELQAQWDETPEQVQRWTLQRERQFSQRLTAAGQEVRALRPYAEVADGHREFFRKIGIQPAEAFDNLVRTARFLEEKPAEALRWLASEHKMKPADIFGDPLDWDAPGQQTRERQPDPEVAELKAQVRSILARNEALEKQLRGVSTSVQQRERAAQEAEHYQAVDMVAGYEKESAPDLKELEADLVPLIETYRRQNPRMPKKQLLEKAVAAARAMNPERVQKAAAEQAKRIEADRIKQASQKAAAGRKASAVNVRSAPRNTAVPTNLNDTRDEIWAKHHAS